MAQAMVADVPGRHRITVGGDKNFDTAGFVAGLQELNATPHVAQNTSNRRSAIDGRTTRHPGYAVSQRIRKRIEEGFGWIKEIALQRRARHRGKDRVGWQFTLGGRGLQPDPAAQAAGGGMMVFGKRPRPGRQNHPSKRPPPHQLHRPNGGPHAPSPPVGTISAAC